MNNIDLGREAKAWVKRKNGLGEIIRVVYEQQNGLTVQVYQLYAAYEDDHLGRILFDEQGYWIYDGRKLSIAEQEQLAKFITTWKMSPAFS